MMFVTVRKQGMWYKNEFQITMPKAFEFSDFKFISGMFSVNTHYVLSALLVNLNR